MFSMKNKGTHCLEVALFCPIAVKEIKKSIVLLSVYALSLNSSFFMKIRKTKSPMHWQNQSNFIPASNDNKKGPLFFFLIKFFQAMCSNTAE